MVSKRFLDDTKSMKFDDLKLILGIGPAIERRLHQAGISTYAQMAALSPDKLAACIKGISIKKDTRKKWIGEARKLASRQKNNVAEIEKTIIPNRQRYAAFTVELLLDAKNIVRRTHVKHIQNGDEAVWAEWHETRLLDFFVKHARLHRQTLEVGPVSSGNSPTNVSMIHRFGEKAEKDSHGTVQTLEVSVAPEADPKAIKTDLPLDVYEMRLKEVAPGPGNEHPPYKYLAIRLIFQLNDDGMRAAAQRSRCLVQIMAYEVTLGVVIMLTGEELLLEPDKLTYTATLTFPLPGLGRYRLVGLIILPDEDKIVTALGPSLNVIL